MAGQEDLLLCEPALKELDQLFRVGDETVDGHVFAAKTPGIGASRTSLVPVDDGEVLLEQSLRFPRERDVRRPGPSVQEEHQRVARVSGPERDPL